MEGSDCAGLCGFARAKRLAFCPAFCYTGRYLFLVRRPAGGINRCGQFVQRNLEKSPYAVFFDMISWHRERDGKELKVTDE